METKKKVIHIISNLGQGGAQILLYDILTKLKLNTNYDILVITIDSGDYLKKFQESGINYIDLKEKGLINFKILLKLRTLLRKLSPDIVHTHLNKADFYGRLAAKFANVKIIISTCHNYSTNHKNADIKKKSFTDRIDNFVTFWTNSSIIAISEIVLKYLINRDKKFKNITEIIYNGINTSKENYKLNKDSIKQLRGMYGIDDGDFLIGLIGRFDIQKGHLFFLKSLKGFIQKNKNVKVLFVGDGVLRNDIENYVAMNSLSGQVVLTGFIPDAEPLIEICNIVCIPSLWEGFGLIALESMIKGKIVVASDTGGLKEIITDGFDGLLFDPLNETQLLEQVKSVYYNFENFSKISKNAITTVKNKFDINLTSRKYHEYYEKKLLDNT